MFKLAELFVDINGNDKPLNRALDGIQHRLDEFAGVGKALFGAVAAKGTFDFLDDAVNKASHLNETLSKTNVILGGSADLVVAEADRMAEAFGTSKREYLDAASGFASVFKGVGKSQEEAAQYGNALTKLAMDMASFDDTSVAEATGAITSALRGEMDPIEKYRVFLDADKVAAEALALGLADTKEAMGDSAKKAAVASLIFKQTAEAQGDLARTAGGYANQQRKLAGSFENTVTVLGGQIMPAFEALQGIAGRALGGISGWIGENEATISGWADAVGARFQAISDGAGALFGDFEAFLGQSGIGAVVEGGIGAVVATFQWFDSVVTETIDAVGFTMRNWASIAELVGLQVGEKLYQIGDVFTWLFTSAIPAYTEWFGNNWLNLLTDAFNGAWTIAQNALTNIGDLVKEVWDFITSMGKDPIEFNWTPILQGFEATVEKLPDVAGPHLTSFQNQIDGVLARIGEDEQRRAEQAREKVEAATAAAAPEANKLPTATRGEDSGGGKKAATMDLAAFAAKLQEGVFGKDTGKQQLDVQKQQLKVQEEQLLAMKTASRSNANLAMAGPPY